MSLNLTLEGFPLFQTPTEVTKMALASDDRAGVYVQWLYDSLGPRPPRHAARALQAWLQRREDMDAHVRELTAYLLKRSAQAATLWGAE